MKKHIVAALAGFVLAAPAAAQEQPVRGGTLVYAVDAEPPNYDCQGTTTFAALQTLNPHRTLDELYERQKRATSEAERVAAIRAFERRLLEEGWTAPIVWWHRIVAHSPALKGWKVLPSHYLNQDLASVWLDPALLRR